jgi:hypothetical protein
MLAELDTYDWQEVFAFIESDGARQVLPDGTSSVPEKALVFTRDDVVECIAMQEGENDGPSWIGVFKLANGRYAFAEGGCDYTGWDCQASGGGIVADSFEALVQWALSDDDRDRLGDALFPVSKEDMAAASAGLRALERSLSDLS